jgi:uncharacterized membrane protein
LIPFFNKRASSLFTDQDRIAISDAIAMAEKKTSGEVRVFVESKCRYLDATDRAAELFHQLEMDKTEARNGVLFYLAMRDHQLAVWGDKGIHEKLGTRFWQLQIDKIIAAFHAADHTRGICASILEIGTALQAHFPYEGDKDKNELSDQVVFGR